MKSTQRNLITLFLLSVPLTAIAQTDGPGWVELAVHNFGAPINTMWAEGELTFAADGTMVYCSAREDNTPVNMGIPINAAPATDVDPLRLGDDREPWITADGNTIYFKSDRLATTSPRNNNDVFVTRKVNGEWSTPEIVGYPISTNEGDEHCPAILQDGETLCFASRRACGYGGMDIWGAQQLSENEWATAFNLGPRINTAAADMCPALPPGGETMTWFSSRQDNSLGNFDIFWTSMSNVKAAP